MDNNIPENNNQEEKKDNPQAYDPNAIFENVHVRQEFNKNSATPEPSVIIEERSNKTWSYIFFLIIFLILGVGGFFFFQYREKENRQVRIGADYSCAIFSLMSDLKQAYDPNQTVEQAQSVGEDLRIKVVGKMKPTMDKYRLTTTQLQIELLSISERVKSDSAFSKKVESEVMSRNCIGSN